ncbi:hypothetical protein BDZ91DRAFT_709316 [Kalaharituber pfeilii]|nr:hypothetical protein BDZ91DRAFT_709316 [Kalaharituber pfeilii]
MLPRSLLSQPFSTASHVRQFSRHLRHLSAQRRRGFAAVREPRRSKGSCKGQWNGLGVGGWQLLPTLRSSRCRDAATEMWRMMEMTLGEEGGGKVSQLASEQASISDLPPPASFSALVTELSEGEYRDYSRLPLELTSKDELHISLSLLARARAIAQEHTALKKKLEEGEYDSATAVKVGKVAPVARALREFDDGFYNVHQLKDMLSWPDPPFPPADLQTELTSSLTALQTLSQTLIQTLVPSHPFSHLPCIIEIRPGTGGSEASLFAFSLYKMYTSYFTAKGWPVSNISLSLDDTIGGGEALNEAILEVNYPGAYNIVRGESGVHRVQRIPLTETKGRVHTSTATVMVLPSFPEDGEGGAEDPSTLVDPKDVKIEVMRARGAGGQHVNKTESAVRLTHVPTGIVVAIQDQRSQHKNKERAWAILRARVAEKARAEKEAEELMLRRKTLAAGASGVVASGGGSGSGAGDVTTGSGGARSDKIRTYNFKEGRVTDHRCGLTVYDLDRVLEGDVEGVERLMGEVGKWLVQKEVERVLLEVGA